jgi:hypothetical protein
MECSEELAEACAHLFLARWEGLNYFGGRAAVLTLSLARVVKKELLVQLAEVSLPLIFLLPYQPNVLR